MRTSLLLCIAVVFCVFIGCTAPSSAPVLNETSNISTTTPTIVADPMNERQELKDVVADSALAVNDTEQNGSVAVNESAGNAGHNNEATDNAAAQSAVSESSTLSITEQYEKDFLALNRPYAYLGNDPGYGEYWFIDLKDKIKYTSPEHLFELNKDGVIVPSAFTYWNGNTPFTDRIQRRELQVMNYITLENGSYSGCFVWMSYYKRENCVWDNDSKAQIFFENFTFTPPKGPLDWLREYHGRTPIKIKYNYTDKEENLVRQVNELYFKNDNGTTTRLIVHAVYHIPVRAELLDKDNKLVSSTAYKYLQTDLWYIKKFRPYFLDS